MNGTFILCVNMLCKNPREYLIQRKKIKGGYPKKREKLKDLIKICIIEVYL